MACNCEKYRADPQPHPPDHDVDERLLITTVPCGGCRACRKIASNSHPDIIRLKPSGSYIKIEQIRSLCRTLAMKPYEAGMRLVIISDAGAMNPAAGNALLKVLEEPPANTIIILVAAHASDLLPTVVSRCQRIRFNPISKSSLIKALVENNDLKAVDAAVIAAMAGGSLSRAQQMYAASWLERRRWLISELESLPGRSLNLSLAFAEKLAKDKDDLPDALEILKSWLRDLIIVKIHPDRMRDHDMASVLQQSSQRTTLAGLLSKFDTIQTTQNAIQVGSNLRLAMESMVLKLMRV
jgi:DNA polymerase-3 subunit delta'